MSRMVSFRGLIKSADQEKISLSTNNGLIGYKIHKFQLMWYQPAAASSESVVKIFKTEQTAVNGLINFDDNRLLAAAFNSIDANARERADDFTVVFDNEKFNQDIYITHQDLNGAEPVNYYIELEQIKLNLDEQTVASLKDIRNTGSQ